MKLYRWLVPVFTLVAFLAAPASYALCYADGADETVRYVENQGTPEEDAQKQLYALQMAFSAGLQTLDAHQYTGNLTEQDKEIIALLDEKIPAIINKIQTSSSEIEKEMAEACETLARKVIANQNLYPAPTDWTMASSFAAMTAVSYAAMGGKIDERVTEILMNETMDLMMQALPQEDEE